MKCDRCMICMIFGFYVTLGAMETGADEVNGAMRTFQLSQDQADKSFERTLAPRLLACGTAKHRGESWGDVCAQCRKENRGGTAGYRISMRITFWNWLLNSLGFGDQMNPYGALLEGVKNHQNLYVEELFRTFNYQGLSLIEPAASTGESILLCAVRESQKCLFARISTSFIVGAVGCEQSLCHVIEKAPLGHGVEYLKALLAIVSSRDLIDCSGEPFVRALERKEASSDILSIIELMVNKGMNIRATAVRSGKSTTPLVELEKNLDHVFMSLKKLHNLLSGQESKEPYNGLWAIYAE